MTLAQDNQDNFVLDVFGFGVYAETTEPDFYMVVESDLNAAVEIPLLLNGDILIAHRLENLPKVVELSGNKLPLIMPEKDDIYLVDLIHSVYLVENEDKDTTGTLLNALNALFDVLKVTSYAIPEIYADDLRLFANHVTFYQEYGDFLSKNQGRRERIRDGIVWMSGVILLSLYPVDLIS